jgi:hypothetical protein
MFDVIPIDPLLALPLDPETSMAAETCPFLIPVVGIPRTSDHKEVYLAA